MFAPNATFLKKIETIMTQRDVYRALETIEHRYAHCEQAGHHRSRNPLPLVSMTGIFFALITAGAVAIVICLLERCMHHRSRLLSVILKESAWHANFVMRRRVIDWQ